MSDINMYKIQSNSIYNDKGLKFQKDPFTYYYRHSVHIPERKGGV